jgi:hypothetical protein
MDESLLGSASPALPAPNQLQTIVLTVPSPSSKIIQHRHACHDLAGLHVESQCCLGEFILDKSPPQKAILLEYAKKNHFPNPVFFVDDGCSGTNCDRPGFQRMLTEIEAEYRNNYREKSL